MIKNIFQNRAFFTTEKFCFFRNPEGSIYVSSIETNEQQKTPEKRETAPSLEQQTRNA